MNIAEKSLAVAGRRGHQSQKRISPRCDASLNMRESDTQMAGENFSYTSLTSEQMKEDFEMFTALLEFTL